MFGFLGVFSKQMFLPLCILVNPQCMSQKQKNEQFTKRNTELLATFKVCESTPDLITPCCQFGNKIQYTSIHPFSGCGGTGAYPSYQWVKAQHIPQYTIIKEYNWQLSTTLLLSDVWDNIGSGSFWIKRVVLCLCMPSQTLTCNDSTSSQLPTFIARDLNLWSPLSKALVQYPAAVWS